MLGYCCINTELGKLKITTNRTMTRKTFDLRGKSYVSELILSNLDGLLKILEWNIEKDIYVFRMSSDMFPWHSEYDITTLPHFNIIKQKLINIGDFVKSNGIRVSFHPGPYTVIASLSEQVVFNAIKDIENHSIIMDLMGLDRTHFYPINIHVNSTKPTKEEALKRFCQNFEKLSPGAKGRLTVENDHSPNQYSVLDLYNGIFKSVKVPITFDQFHQLHGPQDQSPIDALELALSTWPVKPLTHMSSSKQIEDPTSKKIAHSDYLYENILKGSIDFDTDIEAKMKEAALINYRKKL